MDISQQLKARILTEEELQHIERMIDDTTLPTVVIASIVSLMNSHRELFRANAELSFKNQLMKLKIEEIGMIVTGEIMANNIDKHLYTVLEIVKHELEVSK